jgi:hypothetical protein
VVNEGAWVVGTGNVNEVRHADKWICVRTMRLEEAIGCEQETDK